MKTSMKKILALLLTIALVLPLAACGKATPAPENTATTTPTEAVATATEGLRAPVKGDTYKFGIVMMVENPAFTDMRDGIISGLADAGYVHGENATIDYRSAQGDATALGTITQSMANGSYDVVFTIATPATQSFVGLESPTPCIFCAVSDPVSAGVLSALATPDMNATGTSNAIPSGDIIDLALVMTPEVKRFGLLYCTSEANAVSTMALARTYLTNAGMPFEEMTVTSSAEVQQATEALMGKVDAIFVANDAVVHSAMPLVSEICRANGVPVYCSSATTVASGALATLAMSDVAIGEKTAAIADAYLHGAEIAALPCLVVPADIVSVNADAVAALGIDMPAAVEEAYGSIIYMNDAQ